MKVREISETERQLMMETGDAFTHEIGVVGWRGRFSLTAHFLRVAWAILRHGRAKHTIHGGQVRCAETVEEWPDIVG